MHLFKCVLCNKEFETDERATRCPHCGGRALVHLKGRALKAKSCSGCCSGCSGCGH